MHLRPALLWRPGRRPLEQRQRACFGALYTHRTRPRCCRPALASSFHASARNLSDDLPNHYETLHLAPNATPADVKRQFFTLSKQHHPDKNRDDPNASTRFVAISEAYHVLSVPEKRAQYDAHLHSSQSSRSRWGRSEAPTHGSYSSASFAGSRPATGLNKKRGTFRGPPPSFYKSGGYGRHSAKRAEYAHHNPHTSGHTSEEAGKESYGDFGGFGPGQQAQGNEVPHFDDQRHKQMHDHVNDYIQSRRRRTRVSEATEDLDRGGMFANFLLVSSALAIIGLTANWFTTKNNPDKRQKES